MCIRAHISLAFSGVLSRISLLMQLAELSLQVCRAVQYVHYLLSRSINFRLGLYNATSSPQPPAWLCLAALHTVLLWV